MGSSSSNTSSTPTPVVELPMTVNSNLTCTNALKNATSNVTNYQQYVAEQTKLQTDNYNKQ